MTNARLRKLRLGLVLCCAYPATGRTSGACPGFVVDHIKPLKRGGADAPGNTQWQTRAAAWTRSNRQPVSPIIDGGYNLGVPSVRLTIIVRLDQAASLDRLAEFVEVRRTVIGTDVSVLLPAADGPGRHETLQ